MNTMKYTKTVNIWSILIYVQLDKLFYLQENNFIQGLSNCTISKRKLIDDDDNIRLHSWEVIGNFKYSVSVLFWLNSKW
jgi:hypothetical protein